MKNIGLFFRIVILLCFISIALVAQSKRSLVNDGVDLYKSGKYSDAEVNFKKGLEKDNEMFQGHFNLGDAYYKQGRYDEALQSYKNALSYSDDKYNQAKAYHNVGNALLKSQKYQESIGAYKNALKLNPDDLETKYNLSYALNMLKQNQQQQNKNQDKQDQNKDQQQDQNQDQQNKDKNKQDQQQQKNQISKEDAQRILDALKNNETDLQKKLRKVKGKVVVTEKDW